MRLVSTNGRAAACDFRRALFESLAPDGGLFTPESLTPLPPHIINGFRGQGLSKVATTLAHHLLGDEFDDDVLDRVTEDALDFDVPIVPLEDGIFLLELFHGPTLAFKDVGARFMARVMAECHSADDDLTVLVATSGDTGSAVAQAFLGLPRTRIVVLFPEGQVSEIQERQFTTLGDNVRAVAVQGTFDDCQQLAKRAFADRELRGRIRLTSANSINIGRLLPQVFYYFAAHAQLEPSDRGPLFCVPSGNFGNLTAGLMAQRLGLGAGGFVAATNINDVVPEFLRTGSYAPRPSKRTISNAMDVGDPSNLARITHLYSGDVDALRSDLASSSHTDEATRRCIREVHQSTGMVLDPHTAVGYLGLQQRQAQLGGSRAAILLATAHPAKFADTVEEAIGEAVEPPPRLVEHLRRERRVTRMATSYGDLERLLLSR
jgi:threonine synthase